MPIPQDFVRELVSRSDIVDVIGSYLTLKHRGRLYTGLCPFHNEKTPSFTVYPDTQSFYCFGCGAGGDVISFVKKQENLEYVEAVKLLCSRAGMNLPDDADDRAGQLRRRILEANRLAARFFFESLNSEGGRQARAYLRGRGLSDATITRFGIGYSPDSWDALKVKLGQRGFSDQELVAAGLCGRSSKGSVFDFFRNRVMFPVIDIRGNVIAFSGRRLRDEDSPRKYVNTGDTPVFKKSRELFAMNLAKNAPERRLILAEGQMDAIAMHQAGFSGAVAGLGTALTEQQVRLIGQYADEVVICYDSDEAGQKATAKALEAMRSTDLLVRVLTLREAKDADEFIKKFGPDRFAALLNGSDNSLEYQLKKADRDLDLETDSGRVQYLKRATDILSGCESATEREVYAGRLSEKLRISKAAIITQTEETMKRRKRRGLREQDRKTTDIGSRFGQSGASGQRLGALSAGHRLAALLYKSPDLAKLVRDRLEPEDFGNEDLAAICFALLDSIERDELQGLASLGQALSPAQLELLSGILAKASGINFTADDAELYCDKLSAPRTRLSDDAVALEPPERLLDRIKENKK